MSRCERCKSRMFLPAIGVAKKCGHPCSNLGFSYCVACAQKENRCDVCGAELSPKK